MKNKPKLIVIAGTTASGKTKLGVDLCLKFNGEIISADSRQVYKGMDIGTGKDLDEYTIELKVESRLPPGRRGRQAGKSKVIRVPYHLIDVVSPKKRYNLADYQKDAFAAIDYILSSGKVPFLVGGTGLYIQSIVDNYNLTFSVKPNEKLRKKLGMLSIEELIERFQITNSKFQSRQGGTKFKIQNSKNLAYRTGRQAGILDLLQNNKRRIIRYIEIMEQRKKPFNELFKKNVPKYNVLILGLTFKKDTLSDRIEKRLKERLEEEDMIGEVERLHEKGLSWKRLEEFGLEYKWLSFYLKGEISYQEMFDGLSRATKKFAKRQLTWFKRDKRIVWVKDKKEAEKLVKEFFKK